MWWFKCNMRFVQSEISALSAKPKTIAQAETMTWARTQSIKKKPRSKNTNPIPEKTFLQPPAPKLPTWRNSNPKVYSVVCKTSLMQWQKKYWHVGHKFVWCCPSYWSLWWGGRRVHDGSVWVQVHMLILQNITAERNRVRERQRLSVGFWLSIDFLW